MIIKKGRHCFSITPTTIPLRFAIEVGKQRRGTTVRNLGFYYQTNNRITYPSICVKCGKVEPFWDKKPCEITGEKHKF